MRATQETSRKLSIDYLSSKNLYLEHKWDYVITVCGGANESCPMFMGEVKNRLHIGFDDPSEATGTPEFIDSEFHRVRDEIKARFYDFYLNELRPQCLAYNPERL